MCWLTLSRNMTSCITLYHHQGFTFNCVMSVVMHGVISFLLSIVIINTLIVTTCCCCCCWNNYSTNYYDIVCWLCCWTFLLGSITIIIWLLILAQFLPAESVIVFNHPGNEPVPFVIVFLGHDWRTIHNQGSTGSYESILGGDWCLVTMTSEDYYCNNWRQSGATTQAARFENFAGKIKVIWLYRQLIHL